VTAALPGTGILKEDPARDEGVSVTRFPYELLVLGLPVEEPEQTVGEVIEQMAGMPGVRIVDLLMVVMSAGAVAGTVEIIGTKDDRGLHAATPGLIGRQDITEIGSILAPDGTAVALLVEHVWATRLAASIAALRGQWIASVQVPAEHVMAAERAGQHTRTSEVVDSGGPNGE
jgi:hypothetical protein